MASSTSGQASRGGGAADCGALDATLQRLSRAALVEGLRRGGVTHPEGPAAAAAARRALVQAHLDAGGVYMRRTGGAEQARAHALRALEVRNNVDLEGGDAPLHTFQGFVSGRRHPQLIGCNANSSKSFGHSEAQP